MGAKLVNVKHLPHKAWGITPSLEGLPTRAKEAPSPHDVRLVDTNPANSRNSIFLLFKCQRYM